jgi:uncharacterized protein (DUF2336 family)
MGSRTERGVVLNAVPGLKDLVHLAMDDEQAIAELVDSRPDLRNEVAAYLAEHPEIADLIDGV